MYSEVLYLLIEVIFFMNISKWMISGRSSEEGRRFFYQHRPINRVTMNIKQSACWVTL